MRSKLFVPGSRPELFAKALASGADALSFDLEDSVTEDRKAAARAQLRDFLRSGALAGSAPSIIVRVNPLDSPHFADDVLAVVQPGVHMINLPKPRGAEDVRVAAQAVAAAQGANGVPGTVGLLVNIETPGALRHAADLATAQAMRNDPELRALAERVLPGDDRREAGDGERAIGFWDALRLAIHRGGLPRFDCGVCRARVVLDPIDRLARQPEGLGDGGRAIAAGERFCHGLDLLAREGRLATKITMILGRARVLDAGRLRLLRRFRLRLRRCGHEPNERVPDGLLHRVFGRAVERQAVDDRAHDDAAAHQFPDRVGHIGVVAP
mgnify:CR=1 FL=1